MTLSELDKIESDMMGEETASFRKIETVEMSVGSYLLVSVPYGDVILLKEELRQIWVLLPSRTFTAEQLAIWMKEVGTDSTQRTAKIVIERLLQMRLLIKK